MALDDATVQRTKAVLRNDRGDVRSRLDGLFSSGGGWLDDQNREFADVVGDRLTDSDARELTALAGSTTGDDDVLRWLGGWLDRAAAPSPGPERFQSIGRVEGFADWWQAYDTEDRTWQYVRSTVAPDGTTTGWMPYDKASVAMQAPAPQQQVTQPPAARYTNLTAVDGYPGWWQGYDGTTQAWKYVRSDTKPTDRTQGWADQAEAFAAMRTAPAQTAPAQSAPAQSAPGTGPAAETPARTMDDLVAAALADVDGAESLSPDEIGRAIDEATSVSR